ncbi:MAG: TRAP transporter small permease [Desulfosarcina sp.]|nr:TRAP transporter small permease [Desulfosarcina sp.]MBC2744404.1 TRAP transporter small permease [Desulfosarcina sp.]MBC2767312.1 TRAP transporter small permease [Desulfosarcina sp.]
MKAKEFSKQFFDNFESYVCQFLLSLFVFILFIQIIFREVFSYTLTWGEELARFAFVWFVFFGAVVAARLAAHNRVTFQFKKFSKKTQNYIEGFADLIWLIFNGVMIWKSIFLIKSMMQFTYTSPTLGWNMAYVYLIFPISFTLLSIRVIQVNYLKLVKGIDIRDPDKVDMEEEFEKISGPKDA